jgi:hypothetical protein
MDFGQTVFPIHPPLCKAHHLDMMGRGHALPTFCGATPHSQETFPKGKSLRCQFLWKSAVWLWKRLVFGKNKSCNFIEPFE